MISGSFSGSFDNLETPIGAGLLELRAGPRELLALPPDFRIERRPIATRDGGLSGIAVWAGRRGQGRAKSRAAERGVPFLLLGDGLLRIPPGWGGGVAPVLSLTAQAMTGPGSSADILCPSRLLASRGWENPSLLERAAQGRRGIVARRLGGPWWRAGAGPALPSQEGFVLIEAEGEPGRSPSPTLLHSMIAAALNENASQRILVLVRDTGRQGLSPSILGDAASRGCTVLPACVDRWEAIARADCVYTVGGETGFLALLAGRKVHCFADCFYSGWGITLDAAKVQQQPFRRTLDEVFAGTCLLATRYLDPYRKQAATFEDALQLLEEWRKIEAVNRSIAVCVGMSFWKRRQVADFLRSSAGTPVFRRSVKAALDEARARPDSAIAVWASRAPPELAKAAAHHGIPLIRIEDGFVRSVGLGSDFMPPASLVLDGRGMHFDPDVRSDLEVLLLRAEFDVALLQRARGLIAQLVARGVTKYNLATRRHSVEWPAAKRRLLVPGQVEDDLSVRLGGQGIAGNLDLLGRVRAANPDAFIAYKPHPDVEAGHRKGRVPDEAARNFADLVIRDVSTAALLDEIDELHTLTSLAGFEALLRRRRVVVYGRPFYAGWGLTTDIRSIERGRRLTLEELVAGALILYPRYLDPVSRLPCAPEIIIERLQHPELWRPGLLVMARRLQGVLARCWGEVAQRAAKHPARRSPPGRDELGTPSV